MFTHAKLRIFFLLVLATVTVAGAQDKENRKLKKRLESDVNQFLKIGAFKQALPLLQKLDSLEPENPEYNFQIGMCYYNTIDKSQSLSYFQAVQEQGFESNELDFYLARAYHFNHKFDTALNYYDRVRDTFSPANKSEKDRYDEITRYMENCEHGKLIVSDSVLLQIENLGGQVNGKYPDYVPVFSADGKTLMFTSRRPNTTGGSIDRQGRYFEDIYMSKLNSKGVWSAPTKLAEPINTSDHDACIALSADGTKLLMYKATNGGDIFESNWQDSVWSDPQPIRGEVNTKNWESSASISPDGQLLYFTSDKKGGYGGSDIYVAKRATDGSWLNPKNLGPKINTNQDEDAPQIHSDGRTLFFSSKGHEGMGGYDIFSTSISREDSSWTTPKNIGFPVNTTDDDIYFTLSSDGSKGYFASYRLDTWGEKDIYVLNRPASSPAKFIFKGRLFNHETNQAISAKITVVNMQTGKVDQVTSSDIFTGRYSFPVDFDKNYEMKVQAPGYFDHTEKLNIAKQADLFEYVMNFKVADENVYVVEVRDTSYLMPRVNAQHITKEDLIAQREEVLTKVGVNPEGGISRANNLVALTKAEIPKLESGSEFEKFPVSMIVKIVDNKNGERLDAIVDLRSTDDKVIVPGEKWSDGMYKFELSNSRVQNYILLVKKDNYMFKTYRFNVKLDNRTGRTITRSIELDRLEKGYQTVLRNVYFDFGKAAFSAISYQDLDNLYNTLAENSTMKVEISGHTDNIGSRQFNKKLSTQRAQAVVSLFGK